MRRILKYLRNLDQKASLNPVVTSESFTSNNILRQKSSILSAAGIVSITEKHAYAYQKKYIQALTASSHHNILVQYMRLTFRVFL